MKNFFVFLLVCMIAEPAYVQNARRARDYGIPFSGKTGTLNAITDVAGVEVGMVTLIEGDGTANSATAPVRTGVTAILPRGKTFGPVFAAQFSLNGNGEMTGYHWIKESGFLETPILITNTHSVGIVRDATLAWQLKNKYFSPVFKEYWFAYPLVAETYDGLLNDINGFHVKEKHVLQALDNAKGGRVTEGSVGGGTGMVCLGFKGGSGTSSRMVTIDGETYTIGIFVQANFGGRQQLTIRGINVGSLLSDTLPIKIASLNNPVFPEMGSIIVILATDAPLLPQQINRLLQRVPLGVNKTGGIGGNSSGDIFAGFSTANKNAFDRNRKTTLAMLSNDQMDGLFDATINATEEAILNVLFAGETMSGIHGNTVPALPKEKVIRLLKEKGVIK
ncbi:MAG TPA: P1 family peptidase [Flavitalea sp.]|nr:P1 family peptidase [Flavitalea sp.]